MFDFLNSMPFFKQNNKDSLAQDLNAKAKYSSKKNLNKKKKQEAITNNFNDTNHSQRTVDNIASQKNSYNIDHQINNSNSKYQSFNMDNNINIYPNPHDNQGPQYKNKEHFITRTTINRYGKSNRADDAFLSELHEEFFKSNTPDPIDLYLKEIAKHPLLTKEQEFYYGQLVKKGDEKAKEIMIKSNLRLVVKIARRYIHSGMHLLDLIEEGNLGLIRAVEKFEPDKGFRFSTYSAWWIQQNIERAIMSQNRTVRLPIHVVKKLNSFLRKSREVTKKLEHEPSLNDLCNKLPLKHEEIENLMLLNERTISLDTSISNDIEKPILETLCNSEVNPLNQISQDSLQNSINAWLNKLSKTQQEVIARRFGLNEFEPTTLEQTGKEIGITRERVRQLQTEALKILKKHILADGEDFNNLIK